MSAPGLIHASPASSARAFAEGIAWLWRLGDVADEPHPTAVGFGSSEESAALARAARSGRLRTGIVLAGGTSPLEAPLARRQVRGVARFPDAAVSGEFSVLDGGSSVLRSSLGDHAVLDDGLLYVGADEGSWGWAHRYWIYPLLASFLVETLERPLVALPPIGCIRIDDVPGTAQHQLEDRAHGDARMARRIRHMARAYERAGATLVVAIASAALVDGRAAPLEAVWPRAVAELRRAASSGALEPACHGTLHVDTEAMENGVVEPREFARLTEAEAGRRLDEAVAWLQAHVGEPGSFIAPAWGYSEGTLAAAAARELATWREPAPGPLLRGLEFRETIGYGLRGIDRLDYRFLERLAAVGVPPTVVFHGRLLDHRLGSLGLPRDAVTLGRLFLRRDLFRIPRVRGVRWVGAAELVSALSAHDATELDAGGRTLVGPSSSRLVTG